MACDDACGVLLLLAALLWPGPRRGCRRRSDRLRVERAGAIRPAPAWRIAPAVVQRSKVARWGLAHPPQSQLA